MSTTDGKRGQTTIFNFPNQVTSLRLLLAVVVFFLIPWQYYLVSQALFVVAAGTDWLDGYYARKYGQVTARADPSVCRQSDHLRHVHLFGGDSSDARNAYGLRAWMVVVVVGRELLVTAARFLSNAGPTFRQDVGQAENGLQCCRWRRPVLPSYSHLPLGQPAWVWWVMVVSPWAAVLLTVYSGLIYVVAAVRLLRKMQAHG